MSETWEKKDVKVVIHKTLSREPAIALKVIEQTSAAGRKPRGFGRPLQKKDEMPYKLFAVLKNGEQILIAESNCLETLKQTAIDLTENLAKTEQLSRSKQK